MSELKIGLLGAGRIGTMHADLLENQVDGASVTAVFDVMSESAERVGALVDATVFPSAEALINDDSVDAVAIATSTDTHVEMLLAAAAAGKPIFCEKPISLDLDQVDVALEGGCRGVRKG